MSAIQVADVPTLNQNTTGSAATLTSTRTLWGQNFTGAANVTGALSSVTSIGMSGQLTNTVAIGTAPLVITSTTRVANLNVATAGTADTLTSSVNIGGVSFNGGSSINLPGVNTAGTQNTSGTAGNVSGTVAVANGGTGQTTYTNGQLLIGNTTGNTLTKATLTQGSGITITNGAGTITIAATSSGGSVTSVAATVPSFLSVSGSPITTSGTLAISLSGTALPVANGGTGTTTPSLVSGTNVTISGTWPNQTVDSTGGGISWSISAVDSTNYTFSGPGIVSGNTTDPVLYLYKGFTYTFVNTTGSSHPFAIRVSNGGSAYTSGVSGSQNATQTFIVPMNAPSTLYYQCTLHSNMGNTINII